MSSIYIEVYGCTVSKGEAEIMAGLLQQAGFEIIENEKYADLLIIVTCYVKSPTEQKILFRIRQLKDSYPKKKMIVAGCMPEGIYKTLVDIAPEASLVSTHHIKEIVKAVKESLEGKRVEYLGETEEIKLNLPKIRKNPVISIVPISSGCNSACSYCSVRFAKGKLFSYPKEMVVKEVKSSIKQGCKEIWITSQDNSSYGLDEGKAMLPELLCEVAEVPGNFFVKIGMMNPKNVLPILPDLIKAYKNKKIYKFLHIPIQSGDNEVLEKMNRDYKVEDFMKIVKEFEDNLRFQLWTDAIVGFPSETKEQFERTFDLIKKIRPDWVNVSKFGARPKTPAADLNQLSSKIISERSAKISKIVNEIALERNKEWVGWTGDVLVSEKGKQPSQWLGRNFAYKPVIIESKHNLLGEILRVKITEAHSSYLIGKLYI